MQLRLIKANEDILRQIEIVQELISKATTAREMASYVGRILEFCTALRTEAKRNIKDLDYGLEDTLIDILENTQRIQSFFDLINTRLASPIIRNRPEDRISLIVLQWLHDSHQDTSGLPFAVSDGSFAVYPTPDIPPVYLLPISRQQTLLTLPLFYHEFGHLLYICHKPEMDELIAEFQIIVSDYFTPITVRNNRGMAKNDFYRQRVVARWFDWTHEFFCDAVGLTIGGESYLKAFSHCFCTHSRQHYYVPRERQLSSNHPVTWLRIKILLDLAKKYGLSTLADEIEHAWKSTANTYGIQEDYDGIWSEEFFIPLRKMLEDMLTESQPITFSQFRSEDSNLIIQLNPVELLNLAWDKFEVDPNSYRSWEKSTIETYINAH
ncbi:hypothetical protein ES703_72039 [subsurface metagenome]